MVRICVQSGWLVIGCGVRGRPSDFCEVAPLFGFGWRWFDNGRALYFMAFDFFVLRSPWSWNGFCFLEISVRSSMVSVNWATAMRCPFVCGDDFRFAMKFRVGMSGQIVEALSSKQAERSVRPVRLCQDGFWLRVRRKISGWWIVMGWRMIRLEGAGVAFSGLELGEILLVVVILDRFVRAPALPGVWVLVDWYGDLSPL